MIESNKRRNETKPRQQEVLTLEELESSMMPSRTSDDSSEEETDKVKQKSKKKGKPEEKKIPSTPPKPKEKEKKEKLNGKVKAQKLEKSLKIQNREKTPRKTKAKKQEDKENFREDENGEEEDSSSSMYQKSPSHEGGVYKKGSPSRSFSFQGSPIKEQGSIQSPSKPSPLKSPARSPLKGQSSKLTKRDQEEVSEDHPVVNNIFLSNLSPTSPREGHTTSVLSGKKAPKKYSPQKYREEFKEQTDQVTFESSPKSKKKTESPEKKSKLNGKIDKDEMQLEAVGRKNNSATKNKEKSPLKEASFNSPSKKKLQFTDPIEFEILGSAMNEERPSPGKKSREKVDSPPKSPKKGSNEKKKTSPKKGSKPRKEEKNDEYIQEEDDEDEGIDLEELINLRISESNVALAGLEDQEELTPEEIFQNLEMMDEGDYPAYMLFQDEEDRRNYFEELNHRYFEDIEQGKTTPKKKGVEYKKVIFGKRNKIKSRFLVTKNSTKKIELIPS